MIRFPDEDSTDLTDSEVASAIPTYSLPTTLGQLIHLSCSLCEGPMAIAKYERRRRKPHHYTRVTLRCASGHELSQTLLMTWMTDGKHD